MEEVCSHRNRGHCFNSHLDMLVLNEGNNFPATDSFSMPRNLTCKELVCMDAQLCLTLCNPMVCSLPGYTVRKGQKSESGNPYTNLSRREKKHRWHTCYVFI